MRDGVAALVGLHAEVRVNKEISITLDPRVAFGRTKDRIYFVNVGLEMRF